MLWISALTIASLYCASEAYIIRGGELAPALPAVAPHHTDYTPVTVLYVVDKTKTGGCTPSDPTKTLYFVAHMCDANKQLYDGKMVNISLNVPYAEWDPEIGDVVYSDARASGQVRGTNGDKGDEYSWKQTYGFIYNKTFGDIFVSVRTGTCIGDLSYGLTLSFQDKKTNEPVTPVGNTGAAGYKVSEESIAFTRAMELVHGITYESLNQVFRLQSAGTVKTKKCNGYKMAYCFGTEPKYNVTVAVVSDDNNSGFGTFVCPFSKQKHGSCPNQGVPSDNSGAPFNLVTADITEADHAGPVLVRVCGNGRYEEDNKFLLSSVGPKHEHF